MPNFDKEAKETLKYDGLPPLTPSKNIESVIFLNVAKVYNRDPASSKIVSQDFEESFGVVVVMNGKIVCQGRHSECTTYIFPYSKLRIETVDLKGGVLTPGLLTYGAPIGLGEILVEPSTNDGIDYGNPNLDGMGTLSLSSKTPLIKAVDGLQFQGRDTL